MTAAKTRLGSRGPDEGFGIGVCLGDEVVDGGLQVNDGSKHASLEATARELSEEAFNRIKPGCGGQGEVECPAGVPGQPLVDPRMLVGRIVVDDGVDYFPCRDLLLDRVEEANELLVAMALNDVGAPHVLLRRAAIRDDRLKSMAVRSSDVHDNSCPRAGRLNCFGRFGNRPNESEH